MSDDRSAPDAQPHIPWGTQTLWRQLEPLLPGLSVEVVAHADSTNTLLIERARLAGGRRDAAPSPATTDRPGGTAPEGRRQGDNQPCLLVAEAQLQGRGRQGKRWQSSPGASLTFSLAVMLEPRDWAGLSLAVGVALAEALTPTVPQPHPDPEHDPDPAGLPIGLKWPNDVWLLDAPHTGRKLGGILIETVTVGHRRMAVVGVGLNVLPLDLHHLSTGYACLQEIEPDTSAPAALHRVAPGLVQALLTFEREGFAPFAPRFAARDVLRGRAVTTTAPGLPAGIADGVENDGSLRLFVGPQLHRLASGEVSVRLGDDASTRQPPGGSP